MAVVRGGEGVMAAVFCRVARTGGTVCLVAAGVVAGTRDGASAAKTLALNPTLHVANVVTIRDARFDGTTNELVVAWQYHDTAHLPGDACYGYVYGLDSAVVWAAAPDTGANAAWRSCNVTPRGRDSVRIKLGEDIRFNARYYVSVRLQIRRGGDWGPPSPPSDSAFCAISTPSFTWEPVVYFRSTGGGDTVWAFNERVALWYAPGWIGGENKDTIVAYRPVPAPAGFIPVSIGFTVKASEFGAPFMVGIAYDSVPSGYEPSDIGLYTRLPSGQWKLYHRRKVSAGRNLVWVSSGFADSDWNVRGSDPMILMVDTMPPVCTVLSNVSAPVSRTVAVMDSVRITDNCANVVVTFLQSRGDTAPMADRVDTLWSSDTIYRSLIGAGNVQASAGARALLTVSDGPNTATVNLSRQVVRAPAGDILTPANRWTPLRTTAALDTPAIIPAMVRSITGGGYDNTKCRIFRWFDSTAVTDHSTRPHTWVEYAPTKAGVFTLEPGKLMWIKTRASVRLNMGNGVTVSLRDTVKLRLSPNNWTDFALPYGGAFTAFLGDILDATGRPFADSLQFYRWVQSGGAYSAHLIHAPALGVDTFDNPRFPLTSAMTDGYTVYNPLDTAVTLCIPPVCTAMSAVPRLPRAVRKHGVPGMWALTIRAELAEGVALGPVVLGCVPRAGRAVMSGYPVAPALVQAGVRVYDRLSGRHYGHVVWHGWDGGGIEYELEFYNTDRTAQRIRFIVSGLETVAAGRAAVMMVDPAGGAGVPVGAGSAFVVDVPAGGRVYRKLTVGGAGYHTVTPTEVQPLAQFGVFPGPSPTGLTVQFMLPADVGWMEYRLVDAAGRLVWHRTVRTGFRTGLNRISWDAACGSLCILEVAVYDTLGRRTAVRRHAVATLP